MTSSTARDQIALGGVHAAGVLTAAAVGYFAWGEHAMALGLAPAIAYLWAQSPTRVQAGLVAFAYYLAVARGMPHGTAVFFGTGASTALGVGFWFLTAALLATPWAFFWPRGRVGYWWRLFAVLLAVSVPPLGMFGWGNPLTAAGALFPRMAWLGLLATYALMLAYCYAVASTKGARNTLAVHALLALALVYGGTQPTPTPTIKSIDTRLSGVGLGQYDFMQSYHNNRALIDTVSQHHDDALILLPESVAGLWLPATGDLWVDTHVNGTVFVGAAEPHAGGAYSNVIVAMSPKNTHVAYRQRIPVPVGMWNPWREESAVSHWLASGTFELGGVRYGALLCYEQILIWPVLQTFAEKPALVLAPTNAWWSRDTAVPAIQKSIVTAWARLFDTPVATAFNY